MLIVFLGNCQAGVLAGIMKRFVVPYEALTAEFINIYQPISAAEMTRIGEADVAVVVESLRPPPFDQAAIPARAVIHRVPSVNGSFLYPYQGLPHPLKPQERYGNPPYPVDYNDRYLSRMITRGVAPEEALRQYKAFDVAASARVERIYELAIEGQRIVDSRTGYDCAGIIEEWLTREQLFQSAFHYGGRIARHVASVLCERMGLPAVYAQRIRDHLREAPFVPRFLPVHPSVARHFKLGWVTEETRYRYMSEGYVTFDEYVLRYMEARWNPMLEEGIIDAQRKEAGARAKLEAGLKLSPNSPEGLHEMSRLLEQDGDLDGAIALSRRVVALDGHVGGYQRLGVLLSRQGRLEEAATWFEAGTRDDPVSPHAWGRLRDCMLALGRLEEACAAGIRAVEFSINRAVAEAALRRIEAKKAVLF